MIIIITIIIIIITDHCYWLLLDYHYYYYYHIALVININVIMINIVLGLILLLKLLTSLKKVHYFFSLFLSLFFFNEKILISSFSNCIKAFKIIFIEFFSPLCSINFSCSINKIIIICTILLRIHHRTNTTFCATR